MLPNITNMNNNDLKWLKCCSLYVEYWIPTKNCLFVVNGNEGSTDPCTRQHHIELFHRWSVFCTIASSRPSTFFALYAVSLPCITFPSGNKMTRRILRTSDSFKGSCLLSVLWLTGESSNESVYTAFHFFVSYNIVFGYSFPTCVLFQSFLGTQSTRDSLWRFWVARE